jgi:glycosyltransferase involved in cell wall biosynthesis
MTNQPLVSIVLPTYNGARYLEESVQSCLEQSYTNWELIIVDDASKDATPLLIARLTGIDARIRTIRHEVNRKLPGALNTGFAAAQGTYFTWTSDDNRYRPQALATMVDFLESHPDTGLVYTDFSEMDDQGSLLQQVVVPPPEALLDGNRIGGSFLYRRTLADQVGRYAEDLFLAEDYDYWLRASALSRLEPLHVDCYLYRLHTASLTSSQAERVQTATALTLLRNLPAMTWASDAARAKAYFRAGLRLAEIGQVTQARGPLREAMVHYRILATDRSYVLNKLLYRGSGLRTAEEFQILVDALPQDGAEIGAFAQQLRGRYHGEKCFEGHQQQDPATVRYHLPKALHHQPNWFGNRGLWRIAWWAYSH